MRLNIEAVKKIKAELKDKTNLSDSYISELESTKPTGLFFVPEDYKDYADNVQMIRISDSIRVYFIPLASKPQDSPDIMWIVDER